MVSRRVVVPECVRETLMHECVHAWLMLIKHPAGEYFSGHDDAIFQAELARVCRGEPFAQKALKEARKLGRSEARGTPHDPVNHVAYAL